MLCRLLRQPAASDAALICRGMMPMHAIYSALCLSAHAAPLPPPVRYMLFAAVVMRYRCCHAIADACCRRHAALLPAMLRLLRLHLVCMCVCVIVEL